MASIQGRSAESTRHRARYWLTVALLTLATIGSVAFASTEGFTATGFLGVLGALLFGAVLFSYAATMRDPRRTPSR